MGRLAYVSIGIFLMSLITMIFIKPASYKDAFYAVYGTAAVFSGVYILASAMVLFIKKVVLSEEEDPEDCEYLNVVEK